MQSASSSISPKPSTADSRIAAAFTDYDDFNKACEVLGEVINLTESNQFGLASKKPCTTLNS